MPIQVFCDRCNLLIETIHTGYCKYQLSVHNMLLCSECIKSFDELLLGIRKESEEKIKNWKNKSEK